LFAKGYKPSALRFALASVPYRKQLNFTFEGCSRRPAPWTAAEFCRSAEAREIPCRQARRAWLARIAKAAEEFDAGLADDLNTARALGGSVRPGAREAEYRYR